MSILSKKMSQIYYSSQIALGLKYVECYSNITAMNIGKSIGVIALCYIICVIVLDIAGALLVTILPEPDSVRLNGTAGPGSTALYYTVWLVAGSIAGAFFISSSLEATKNNALIQQKPIVIFIIALFLSVALTLFLYSVGEMKKPGWSYDQNHYVPGHRYMTFVFFISFLFTTYLLRNMEKNNSVKEK